MGINEQLLEETRKNNRLLIATLALLAQEYELRPGESTKIELLLAAKGLGYQDIAVILDKKPDAVRMMLARNKKDTKI